MTYSTEPVPTWALCLLLNDDPSGLTNEEIEMVDKWCKDNGISVVCTAAAEGEECEPYFTHYPAFGLPCEVIDCNVIVYE